MHWCVQAFNPLLSLLGLTSSLCNPPLGMATIGNMGAEVGATGSIFGYTASMGRYLQATRRAATVDALRPYLADLRADKGAEYDQVIEIVRSTVLANTLARRMLTTPPSARTSTSSSRMSTDLTRPTSRSQSRSSSPRSLRPAGPPPSRPRSSAAAQTRATKISHASMRWPSRPGRLGSSSRPSSSSRPARRRSGRRPSAMACLRRPKRRARRCSPTPAELGALSLDPGNQTGVSCG
jgi:hypothetical protein